MRSHRDRSPRRVQRSLSPPRPVKFPDDLLGIKGMRDPSPARDKMVAEGVTSGSKGLRDPSPARAPEGAYRVFEPPLLSIEGLPAVGSSVGYRQTPQRQRQRLDSDQDSDWDPRSPTVVETRGSPLPTGSFSPDLEKEWAPATVGMWRTCSLP